MNPDQEHALRECIEDYASAKLTARPVLLKLAIENLNAVIASLKASTDAPAVPSDA